MIADLVKVGRIGIETIMKLSISEKLGSRVHSTDEHARKAWTARVESAQHFSGFIQIEMAADVIEMARLENGDAVAVLDICNNDIGLDVSLGD